MRRIFYATSVFLLIFTSSCNRDDANNGKINVTKENKLNKVEKLKKVKKKMKKIDFSSNEIKIEDIKDKYKENLNLINKEVGLDLKYDEGEFKTMISSLDSEYLSKGFIIPKETYNKNLLNIDKNSSKPLFNEANAVLSSIYKDDILISEQKKGISRACALALAGNFLSTLGLSACITGAGCPVAIAAKVLALASVVDSCTS